MKLKDRTAIINGFQDVINMLNKIDVEDSGPKTKTLTVGELRVGEYAITIPGDMGILCIGDGGFTAKKNFALVVNLENGIGGFQSNHKCRKATITEAFEAAKKSRKQ